MHSILYAEPGKDGEASGLDCETPVKKVSVQSQLPSKFFNERVATPRVRCAFFDDEARPLNYRKPSVKPCSDHHTTETEVLVSASSSGNFQKPWPSRKVAEVEELVKYMSSVPCYLQSVEKGENVQGKALNFGVIDWRQLERWTSSKKTAQRNEASSAINMAESPSLLTNQSCSNSGRNNSNSPAQGKQAPCRSSSNSTVEGKQTFSLFGHWDQPDEQKKHEDRTSMQADTSSSIEEEKSKSCDHQNSNRVRGYSGRTFERSLSEHGCDFDDLKGSRCVKGNTLSSMHGGKTAMEVKKHPQRFSHQSSAARDILQSGFLSATFQTDKSNMGATALPLENGVPSAKYMSVNEECNQISKSSGNFLLSPVYQSCDQNADGGRRETLPKKHSSDSGMKWLNRSSSLKDVSSNHQHKDINGLIISDDKGRSNSRGRRSPLRRLLDPLLKSKYDGYSGPITSSRIPISQENHNNQSVSAGKESSSLKSMHRLSDTSNTKMPITPQSLLQDERNVVPMRQALVKLAWKNGQPLFMFSTSENSVLVASLKRTNRLGKEDCSGVYKIVMAQESKKKGGIWIGHGGSRKPSLLYEVVGRLEVSCSKLCSFDSKSFEVSKQFVLVNEELLPNQGCVNSTHTNQLVAIVVKAPYQMLNGFLYKRSSLQIDSLQVEKFPEYSRACSISAIVPSGIHGFSDLGTPSALIERWKTGGSCDCVGWDEGCRLTVLADRLHEMKVASSVQERPTTECFRCIELFIQGGKKEKKHAFSMIAFKEGLYTVEFGSMITSLQAFAICIATLHSRTSIDALDYSAKRRSLEDAIYENYSKMSSMQNNGGSTSYEPHHPPFSPVGRS
ncbi:uncharacterized protein LOC110031464 [Phalaenopsis equestris]|uniref:uncharacterized protein LOC110031464 n=1 Tax=Phalaenopsis equestris TaxID=78828 RepID=UPI0009E3C31B|nr:uncharacterized protein LOC110031464 [Phalaenopsis equestris]XP_020590329.1 uncharacterized protein LOC110031464 [Phalaenopsis equestris]XP_020590330.1 uncharacterized protein LOC110031464 [Phalaenopsis equestris]